MKLESLDQEISKKIKQLCIVDEKPQPRKSIKQLRRQSKVASSKSLAKRRMSSRRKTLKPVLKGTPVSSRGAVEALEVDVLTDQESIFQHWLRRPSTLTPAATTKRKKSRKNLFEPVLKAKTV